MRWRARPLLMIASACLACSCAAPVQPVTLVFEEDGAPLVGAHVRAVSLSTNDVPLPVSQETLGQVFAQDKLMEQGWTDQRGEVEMVVLRDSSYRVEVSESPTEICPIPTFWHWRFVPQTGVITPIPVDGESPKKEAKWSQKPSNASASETRTVTLRVR